MVTLRQVFMILVIIFKIASTRPMPLYPPCPFRRRIMMFQFSYAGRQPSQKSSCVILTTASHLVVVGSLSRVASIRHIFRCSAHIPDGPPDFPVWIPSTSAAISSSLGGSLLIAAGWTRNGMGYSYWASILNRSSCYDMTLSSTSQMGGGRCAPAWR